MNTQTITEELLRLLEGEGVALRREAMGGSGGGLCVFRDKKVYFFDTDAGAYEAACVCAKAVFQVIGDLENVYLKPAVREFIDRNTGAGTAE